MQRHGNGGVSTSGRCPAPLPHYSRRKDRTAEYELQRSIADTIETRNRWTKGGVPQSNAILGEVSVSGLGLSLPVNQSTSTTAKFVSTQLAQRTIYSMVASRQRGVACTRYGSRASDHQYLQKCLVYCVLPLLLSLRSVEWKLHHGAPPTAQGKPFQEHQPHHPCHESCQTFPNYPPLHPVSHSYSGLPLSEFLHRSRLLCLPPTFPANARPPYRRLSYVFQNDASARCMQDPLGQAVHCNGENRDAGRDGLSICRSPAQSS